METHKFKLLSGVECEIGKLMGKHQRLFTQSEFTKDGKGANMAIADILVKLGNKTSVTEDEVNRMLSQDRNQILIQARIFSLRRHKVFKFDFKYENENGKMITEPMELDVEAGDFQTREYKQQFESYDEIWNKLKSGRWASTTLEDCGKEVFFKPMDGISENKVANFSKKRRSSHTLISVHNPTYHHVAEGEEGKKKEGALIQLNLDELSMDDIEDLRVAIKEEEGFQDSKAIFENPESGQDDEVDVLQIPAFFFPSNAM